MVSHLLWFLCSCWLTPNPECSRLLSHAHAPVSAHKHAYIFTFRSERNSACYCVLSDRLALSPFSCSHSLFQTFFSPAGWGRSARLSCTTCRSYGHQSETCRTVTGVSGSYLRFWLVFHRIDHRATPYCTLLLYLVFCWTANRVYLFLLSFPLSEAKHAHFPKEYNGLKYSPLLFVRANQSSFEEQKQAKERISRVSSFVEANMHIFSNMTQNTCCFVCLCRFSSGAKPAECWRGRGGDFAIKRADAGYKRQGRQRAKATTTRETTNRYVMEQMILASTATSLLNDVTRESVIRPVVVDINSPPREYSVTHGDAPLFEHQIFLRHLLCCLFTANFWFHLSNYLNSFPAEYFRGHCDFEPL